MSVGAELDKERSAEPLDLEGLELEVRRDPADDWEVLPVELYPTGLIGLGTTAVTQVSGGEAIVASEPGQEDIIHIRDKTVSIINGPGGIEAYRLPADEADDNPGSLESFRFE